MASSSVDISVKAGEMINLVVPKIVKTADIVQEITSVSKEQKKDMKQLRNSSNNLEKIIMVLSSNSVELASASEEMASQSEALVDLVNTFRISETNNLIEYDKK